MRIGTMREESTITKALKHAMRESGESLYRIAKSSGVNHDSLSRFLHGRTSLRLDLADRLAAHLGVKVYRPGKKSVRPARRGKKGA